jgi:hypothetical protein
MHPLLALFLLVTVPLLFVLLAAGPIYVAVCAASVLYYGTEMQAYIYNPAYMLDLYRGLLLYATEYAATLSFSDFVLPVLVPLLIGALVGLGLVLLLARYIRNIFTVR